MYLFYQDKLLL